jgi:hypothetical protein
MNLKRRWILKLIIKLQKMPLSVFGLSLLALGSGPGGWLLGFSALIRIGNLFCNGVLYREIYLE